MGIFNKKKTGRMDSFSFSDKKDMMKALGLEPAEGLRDLFGWTEEDDRERVETDIAKKERALHERLRDGCTLREEMELEIEIDGVRNYLKSITK